MRRDDSPVRSLLTVDALTIMQTHGVRFELRRTQGEGFHVELQGGPFQGPPVEISSPSFDDAIDIALDEFVVARTEARERGEEADA